MTTRPIEPDGLIELNRSEQATANALRQLWAHLTSRGPLISQVRAADIAARAFADLTNKEIDT